MADPALRRPPLRDLQKSLGAKMVPFAGYDMPVQYAAGIMAEHLHTRAEAGLFAVSHIGQPPLQGAGAAPAPGTLVPGANVRLSPRRDPPPPSPPPSPPPLPSPLPPHPPTP